MPPRRWSTLNGRADSACHIGEPNLPVGASRFVEPDRDEILRESPCPKGWSRCCTSIGAQQPIPKGGAAMDLRNLGFDGQVSSIRPMQSDSTEPSRAQCDSLLPVAVGSEEQEEPAAEAQVESRPLV